MTIWSNPYRADVSQCPRDPSPKMYYDLLHSVLISDFISLALLASRIHCHYFRIKANTQGGTASSGQARQGRLDCNIIEATKLGKALMSNKKASYSKQLAARKPTISGLGYSIRTY